MILEKGQNVYIAKCIYAASAKLRLLPFSRYHENCYL